MGHIDCGLISKIIEIKSLSEVREARITENFFSGDARAVFAYITSVFDKTGDVVTARQAEKKFPRFDFDTLDDGGIGNAESLNFWLNEIRRKHKHNTLADTVEEVAKLLDDEDADSAFSLLQRKSQYISTEIDETLDIHANDALGRLEAYEYREAHKGVWGIPTGFEKLDNAMHGFAKQTLTTLVGSAGFLKSWITFVCACNAILEGYTVVIGATELSDDLIRDRMEALLCAKLHGEFDYNGFKDGKLSARDKQLYKYFLENDLPKLPNFYIVAAETVSQLEGVVEKYKADILFVDSVYLMQDVNKAQSDWLRLSNIANDLKRLSKRADIPIFINTQADKKANKEKGAELSQISFTQGFAQASDTVISLFRDEAMFYDSEIGMRLVKLREGVPVKILLHADLTKTNFEEIRAERIDDDNERVEVVI